MFPGFHAFAAQQIFRMPPQPLILLGAIYPDMVYGVEDLSWDDTHLHGAKLLRICRSIGPKAELIAKGALTHVVAPRGLDHYSDNSWRGGDRGYMFVLAQDYVALATRLCGFPTNIALWKTHNIVEIAFELEALRQDQTWLSNLNALSKDDALLLQAAKILERVHSAPAGSIMKALKHLTNRPLFSPTDPLPLVARFASHLSHGFGLTGIDIQGLSDLVRCIHESRRTEMEAFTKYVLPKIAADVQLIL